MTDLRKTTGGMSQTQIQQEVQRQSEELHAFGQTRHAAYRGPIQSLQGMKADVRDSNNSEIVIAQFDDSRLVIGYGWYPFAKGDFT